MANSDHYEFIKLKREGKIGWLTLNRPEVLNAWNEAMLDEMISALESMSQDLSCRVVIIKGEGPSFCAGLDLRDAKKRARDRSHDASAILFDEATLQYQSRVRRVSRLLWESPVVAIAQVHGYVIESAIAMTMMCDLVIAAEDARFFWRSIGGGGLLWHLWPWTVGLRKTKEILFRAQYVTGKEAEEMGMINKSVPLESLEEEVNKWARKVAERPREFLYLDKMATNKAFEMMGLNTACDNAALAHIVSHLTEPSRELERKLAEAPTEKEAKQALADQASPYAHDK